MKKLREKFLEVSTSNEGSPPWVRLALPARQGDALPLPASTTSGPRHLRLSRPAHSLNPRITTHFAPSSRLPSRLHERILRSKCAATCIEFLSFHLGGNANAQHKKFGPLRPCCHAVDCTVAGCPDIVH